jgi:hypothetical protein
MNKMLSINETFLFLPNQLLSLEYNELLCIPNMKIWLIVHFFITRLIESFLLMNIIFPLQLIMILFFRGYWRRIHNVMESNWVDVCHRDRYSLMIIVLKKDVKLIFVYVYVSVQSEITSNLRLA